MAVTRADAFAYPDGPLTGRVGGLGAWERGPSALGPAQDVQVVGGRVAVAYPGSPDPSSWQAAQTVETLFLSGGFDIALDVQWPTPSADQFFLYFGAIGDGTIETDIEYVTDTGTGNPGWLVQVGGPVFTSFVLPPGAIPFGSPIRLGTEYTASGARFYKAPYGGGAKTYLVTDASVPTPTNAGIWFALQYLALAVSGGWVGEVSVTELGLPLNWRRTYNEADQTQSVAVPGPNDLVASVTGDLTWNTAVTGAPGDLSVAATPLLAGVLPGSYSAVLHVTSVSQPTLSFDVPLGVEVLYVPQPSPTSLTLINVPSGEHECVIVDVVAGGLAAPLVDATTDEAWLTADADASATPLAVNVCLHPVGLGVGVHTGNVRLRWTHADDTLIPVTMTVVPVWAQEAAPAGSWSPRPAAGGSWVPR